MKRFAIVWLGVQSGCASLPDLPRTQICTEIKECVERIPGAQSVDIPVFLNPALPQDRPGWTYFDFTGHPRYVEVRSGLDPDFQRFVVAHEYVHAALGPDWDALPATVEEGLAHRLATQVAPAHREEMRSGQSGQLYLALQRCPSPEVLPKHWNRLGVREIERLPEGSQEAVDVLGYIIADEVSIEELHALSLRAREAGERWIPATWLLDSLPKRRGTGVVDEDARVQAFRVLESWLRDNPPTIRVEVRVKE